jgi:hypothetical protein
MRRLSVVAAACAIAAVIWGLLPSYRLVWSKGKVSPAHAFIENDCGACHGGARLKKGILSAAAGATRSDELVRLHASAGASGAVTDEACASCHRGPQHHKNQLATPFCVSCHVEHSEPRLVVDRHCTSCHASLTTSSGPPEVAAAVVGFPDRHPEFRAVAAKTDPGRLRLNHDVHLWPGLKGPDGPAALTCLSCHVPDHAGRGFLPIKYDAHCSRCHRLALDVDKQQLDSLVPHGDLARAGEFVRVAYEEKAGPDPSDRDAAREKAAVAFSALRGKTCGHCHAGESSHAAAPRDDKSRSLSVAPIEPVQIVARWMPRAKFDHRRHRELGCASCHAAAETSSSTADVLLPGKAVCAKCHSATGGARAGCVDCHAYHADDTDKLGPAVFSLP